MQRPSRQSAKKARFHDPNKTSRTSRQVPGEKKKKRTKKKQSRARIMKHNSLTRESSVMRQANGLSLNESGSSQLPPPRRSISALSLVSSPSCPYLRRSVPPANQPNLPNRARATLFFQIEPPSQHPPHLRCNLGLNPALKITTALTSSLSATTNITSGHPKNGCRRWVLFAVLALFRRRDHHQTSIFKHLPSLST